ncbi:MAG: type II toxin-antitoxin system VapC family toxin [Phycisphaerae bacterium]|nr:type II toxin-antitoxin system VapC family toxin [Phycisphaerae bacterium]
MLFVDTSVIVAFYVPESGSRRAETLFTGGEPLAICTVSEVEFASAIAKLHRIKAINKADAGRILEQFAEHVRQKHYSFCPLSLEVYDQARQWIASLETPLRTLDAIQLAAAHLSDLPMVTADKALAKSARTLGIAVRKL